MLASPRGRGILRRRILLWWDSGHIERDLRNISGTSLVWQTEGAGDASWDERSECERASAQPSRDDDNPEESPLQDFRWQSYHVFFVSPNGEEFRFEAETIGDDPEDGAETTVRGEGQYGLGSRSRLPHPLRLSTRPAIRGLKTVPLHLLVRYRIFSGMT
jgi:hypothetical protein